MPSQFPRYLITLVAVSSPYHPVSPETFEAENWKLDNGVLCLSEVVPMNQDPNHPYQSVILPVQGPIIIDDRWPK